MSCSGKTEEFSKLQNEALLYARDARTMTMVAYCTSLQDFKKVVKATPDPSFKRWLSSKLAK